MARERWKGPKESNKRGYSNFYEGYIFDIEVCLLQWVLGAKVNTEERTVNPAPDKRRRKTSKPPALRLATWNVRTMCPGLSDDLQQIDDARKTAVISRELKRLNIDIAALQETRLPSNGSLKEEDYTFFWQGKAPEEHRVHGVGFAEMKGTVQYDGSSSDPFPIKSGVKQGCVLAPTLFGILFSLLLRYAFSQSEEGIYLHTRSDGSLFNLARLRAKTKVRKVLIREMLFADDAAITAHTETALQELINCFAHACSQFGLTISIKKTNILGQDVSTAPSISIGDCTLDVVEDFTYLGSTISSNLSLDTELNRRIGKASTAMARLTKRVWENTMLTIKTKTQVYQACVLCTLLYGSESWTPYTRQERRLNAFHLRCLRRILGITWQDRIPNTEVLARAGTVSMYALLTKRRLRWLGHVTRMQDGRLPKDILYGELATGSRPTGRPSLRYKDVLKRDLKAGGIAPAGFEALAADRSGWRSTTMSAIKTAEQKREEQWEDKRARRRQRAEANPSPSDDNVFACSNCSRICRSRIGLYSHSRRCSSTTD
ncbi:putative uncharacterized transposon-derived protein F52C9.6 [Stylophora pistillata]|uniref:Uncharacterized transposon-derived protein F52C9.6 n=1 Tax=Stylophora pistillata TaxID=50429 RepID=A0A2B4RFJ9_STYPI|nr:putative uncharacterized transposon-derived protein F52C9.6 [Stylophora pistillata]